LQVPFHNGKTSLLSITLTERTTNQKPKAKRKNGYPILGLHRMLLIDMEPTANDVVILSAKRAQKLGPVNFLVTPSQVQICIIKKKKEVSNTFLGNKQQERGIMGNRENKTNLIDSGSAAK